MIHEMTENAYVRPKSLYANILSIIAEIWVILCHQRFRKLQENDKVIRRRNWKIRQYNGEKRIKKNWRSKNLQDLID
jgi:hypothetical protein